MGKNVEWSREKKAEAKLFTLEKIILVFRAGDLVFADELECLVLVKIMKTNLALYRSKLA